MGWILYAGVVLVVSGVIGLHLGRFREAYTEMLGMMVGMTMGMLNGFVLGYAAAAFTNSMVWGNLFGILLGLALGVYFGRPGGLMGLMDGGMGGVMGGSMGAMLAIMVRFPPEGLVWTAVLLAAVYVVGMLALVVLVERSTPGHVALHRLAPWFARAIAAEVEEAQAEQDAGAGLVNYYELLDIPVKATNAQIAAAYMTYTATTDEEGQTLAEAALTTLSNAQTRTRYDRALAVASGRDACCPPPRRSTVGAVTAPAPTQTPAWREAAAAPATSMVVPAGKRLVDYYAFLGVRRTATEDEITDAYLTLIDGTDASTAERAERAIVILMDPAQRAEYDRALVASRAPANGMGANGTPRAGVLAAEVATAPVLAASAAAQRGNGAHGPAAGVSSGQSASLRPTPNGAPARAASGPRGNDKQPPPGRPPSGNGSAGPSTGRNGTGTVPVRAARPPAAPRATAAPAGGGRAAGAKNTARRSAAYQPPPPAWQRYISFLPGVAILVGIVVVAAIIGNLGGGQGTTLGASSGGVAPVSAKLAAQAVEVPLVNGVQTQDVVLNGNTFQYEPKVLKVKQGIPVRFNLSVKGDPG